MMVWGANPSFNQFNLDQFATNGQKVAIKSGAGITNVAYISGNAYGLTNLSGPSVRILYVDAVTGDDSKLYPYPFKTFEAAHSNAVNGDIIRLSVGHYTNALPILAKEVTIVGAGKYATTIYGPTAQQLLIPSNNLTVMDLTLQSLGSTGVQLAPTNTTTNIFLRNVRLVGAYDNIYCFAPQRNFRLEQCEFQSAYDCFVCNFWDYTNYAVLTNNQMTFVGCTFRAVSSNSNPARCVTALWGMVSFVGCEFVSGGTGTGGDISQQSLCLDAYAGSVIRWIFLNNCSFRLTGTALSQYTVYNMVGTNHGDDNVFLAGDYDLTDMRGKIYLNGLRLDCHGAPAPQTRAILPRNCIVLGTGHSWVNGYHAGTQYDGWLAWFTNYWCNNYTLLTNQGVSGLTVSNWAAGITTNLVEPYLENYGANAYVMNTLGANEVINNYTNYGEIFECFSNAVKTIAVTYESKIIISTIPPVLGLTDSDVRQTFRTNWNQLVYDLSANLGLNVRVADLCRSWPADEVARNNGDPVSGFPGKNGMRHIAEVYARCLMADYER